MKRIRFNIASLLGVILVLGVGFAGLRESNDTWDSSIFSITLCFLLISIPLAVDRTDKRRAFWMGFALFGSAYLGFSLSPPIESRLITTRALTFLDSKVAPSIPTRLTYNGLTDTLVVNNSQPIPLNVTKRTGIDPDVNFVGVSIPNILVKLPPSGSSGTAENFVRIGHSLLALISALLGGLISRRLYAKNREPVYA
jgi:hypothetical protein